MGMRRGLLALFVVLAFQSGPEIRVERSEAGDMREETSRGQDYVELQGDYLGQPRPGDAPVVFARGIVSSDHKEHWAPRFSPDGNEVFWWTIRQDNDRKWISWHKTMRRVGGVWTLPQESPYGAAPVFSPDGQRLYFGSEDGNDPFFVEKLNDSWSEPKPIDLLTRFPDLGRVAFPTIAANGNLYFMGDLEGQWAGIGIYRAEFVDGAYAEPVPLPPSINSLQGARNWTPFVAPDESYLLFCSTRGIPASDQGDLFLSFRQPDGGWTEPVGLGETINSEGLERFPAVSPDGKYLFFTQRTPDHDEDVMWVSAGIIDRLKAEVISTGSMP